jgi:hypothetical protein
VRVEAVRAGSAAAAAVAKGACLQPGMLLRAAQSGGGVTRPLVRQTASLLRRRGW